jgi:hypothetical protein
MKKIISSILFCLLCCSGTFAQNVPNGGFENWTSYGLFEYPDVWQTTDSFSIANGSHSVTKETSVIHGGVYALKLTPFSYSLFSIPGAASNGKINTSTPIPTIEGGSPDTVRHAKLQGWYQYAPLNNDSCSVTVTLYKRNGSSRISVASGTFGTGVAASSYTPFEINLVYATADTPDSVLIIVYSSALGASHLGTVLWVDDFSFTGIVGIHEKSDPVNAIDVFPVPATHELNVVIDLTEPLTTSFNIFDATGKKIMSHPVRSSTEKIDVGELPDGIYFYSLVNDKGTRLYTGKFNVSK